MVQESTKGVTATNLTCKRGSTLFDLLQFLENISPSFCEEELISTTISYSELLHSYLPFLVHTAWYLMILAPVQFNNGMEWKTDILCREPARPTAKLGVTMQRMAACSWLVQFRGPIAMMCCRPTVRMHGVIIYAPSVRCRVMAQCT